MRRQEDPVLFVGFRSDSRTRTTEKTSNKEQANVLFFHFLEKERA